MLKKNLLLLNIFSYDELDETEYDDFDHSIVDNDSDLKYYGEIGGVKPVEP